MRDMSSVQVPTRRRVAGSRSENVVENAVVFPRRQDRVEPPVSTTDRVPVTFSCDIPNVSCCLGPGSAAHILVVPETPASQDNDVVLATPALATGKDPVLDRMIASNAEGLRKRRLALGLSPEFQVPQPPQKHRLVNAILNISTLFELVFVCVPLESYFTCLPGLDGCSRQLAISSLSSELELR
jgi:hypothetical protein